MTAARDSTKRIIEVLADGDWHTYPELVAAIRGMVAPEDAIRRYLDYTKPKTKIPLHQMVTGGLYYFVAPTLQQRYKRGIYERCGEQGQRAYRLVEGRKKAA